MNIAVIDDDTSLAEQLLDFIRCFAAENAEELNASAFSDPREFLATYKYHFDILLCDIEMPLLDGISFSKKIREIDRRVTIMFITNLAQYAIDSYEVEAVDYVLKPLSYGEFAIKLRKAIRFTRRNADPRVILTSTGEITNVKVSDITHIEVRSHYLYYHITDKVVKVRDTMKNAENELMRYGFYRINHGYLVNMNAINSVKGNVLFIGEAQLPIARNRRKGFMETFSLFVNGFQD